MKKIYKSPSTDVYKFSIDGLLLTPSQDIGPGASTAGDPDKLDIGTGGTWTPNPDDDIDPEDFARNGGGSIWDNAW